MGDFGVFLRLRRNYTDEVLGTNKFGVMYQRLEMVESTRDFGEGKRSQTEVYFFDFNCTMNTTLDFGHVLFSRI